MFRDDEEAARLRRDTVAADVEVAQRMRDELARKVGRARRLPTLVGALVVAAGLASVVWARIAGSRDVVHDRSQVVVVQQSLTPAPPAPPLAPPPAPPPPPSPPPAPAGTDEERCRLAEPEPCARLAAGTTDRKAAYRLWRRACLAGHDNACLVVANAFIAAHDPETAVALVAQQCAFGHAGSCAWVRRRCDQGVSAACDVDDR